MANNDAHLNKAIQCLRHGEVIITPSESCYGLSCDATNPSAVTTLHNLKHEPHNKPLTLLVSSLKQIEEYGLLNQTAMLLSQRFHPGQLNLIVPLRDPKKYAYLSTNGTIAFRIPDHPMLLELTEQFGPITTTSANTHGQPPIYTEKEISNHPIFSAICHALMPDRVDQPLPSTIYDTINHIIVRQGPVTEDQLIAALGR